MVKNNFKIKMEGYKSYTINDKIIDWTIYHIDTMHHAQLDINDLILTATGDNDNVSISTPVA